MKTPKVETETAVEQPKAAVSTEVKTSKTAVLERRYVLKNEPSLPPKGKQRQIVLQILRENKDKPMTIDEIYPIAEKLGLVAVDGVKNSVRYHLHHLELARLVEVVNPTVTQTVAA